MVIAAIKRVIPLSVKERLKALLITPDPPPRKKRASSANRVVVKKGGAVTKNAAPSKSASAAKLKLRPCTPSWPRSVCECDMHLGAFRQERIQAKLLKLLDQAGIEYVKDPGGDKTAHVAISIESVPRVEELLGGSGLIYEIEKRLTEINEYDFPATKDGALFSSLVSTECYEVLVQPMYFCEARKQDARAMSVLISTFNDASGARLFHSRLARARTSALDPAGSRAFSVASKEDDPIDIVITTVDGSDPAWQEKFNAMLSMRSGAPVLAKTANAARYTSHDELRFVLRSINYYAPYVRTIHIVTDAQIPEWVDVDHPKINMVDHRDIIDPEYLPTFNSDAIESCLWKIPGLSERFIYFNDDVLLMAPTTEETFYTIHGLPRFFASPRRIPAMPVDWSESYTMHAHLQSAAALEDRGYERPLVKYRHVPFAGRKTIFQEMEAEFFKELSQTRSSPVRSESSFATISFLYPNYALATRSGVLSDIGYRYIDISWEDWRERLLKACQRTDVKIACVNESHDAFCDDSSDSDLTAILLSRFPCVAPWEHAPVGRSEGGVR